MKTINIDKINQSSITPEGFIITEDFKFDKIIESTANQIAKTIKDKRIVLLSGPSGSGKTTTAFKLEKTLDLGGMSTTVINMDKYFKPNPNKDEKLDLESPDRVDAELLVNNINDLLKGNEIKLPDFNFKTGERDYSKESTILGENEIIIIEGIHVLNKDLLGDIFDRSTGIYVSPRTRIELSDGRKIHPKKIRLLRRILRDSKYRGASYQDVIIKSKTVDNGEDLYIMPNKENAEIHIDTFIPYEVSVMKLLVQNKFNLLDRTFLEEYDLIDLLDLINEINIIYNQDIINGYSILREFIGGSKFKY